MIVSSFIAASRKNVCQFSLKTFSIMKGYAAGDMMNGGGPDVVCVNNMDKMGRVIESPMN